MTITQAPGQTDGTTDGSQAAAVPSTAVPSTVAQPAATQTTATQSTATLPAVNPEPVRAPQHGGGLAAGWIIVILAVVTLSFVGYMLGISGLQEARTQDTLYATFRGQLAQEGDAVAPVAPPIKEGAAVAILAIPSLNVRQVVVEGTTSADLTRGPGHRRNTPLPGQAGTSVIYGRRAAFGAPFRDLPNLRIGDRIVVTTGLGVSTFAVSGMRDGRTPPTPLTKPVNRIALVTSAPSVGPTHTLVVTADLTTAVLPSGGTLPGIYPDEQTLAGETSAILPLVLWGQVLLLALLGATWLFHRWDRWATYLVATPVVVAVMWNVFENVARLLPNLL